VFFIAHQYGFFGREEVVMKRAIKKSDRIRNRESVNVAKNANMNNVGQTKSSSKNV
jgi:hypothetical protein